MGSVVPAVVVVQLDGMLLDVTGWTVEERTTGAMLVTEIGAYGPGGRADHEPRLGTPDRWDWQGDVP
ncbi:hypothetical protein ACFCZT_09270 [Streptomyces sp. NPDC056230]|uniref:hypothetical protein n=1 Tax=unclassified Streptomyces TaxID=2593676 RepID=UPI0035DDDBC7